MNSIEFQGTTYQVGQRVRVSNGKPQPPARFKRKLKAWINENWTGEIAQIQAPGRYETKGALVTTVDRHPDSDWMVLRVHVTLGSHLSVTPLEETA